MTKIVLVKAAEMLLGNSSKGSVAMSERDIQLAIMREFFAVRHASFQLSAPYIKATFPFAERVSLEKLWEAMLAMAGLPRNWLDVVSSPNNFAFQYRSMTLNPKIVDAVSMIPDADYLFDPANDVNVRLVVG